MDTTTILAVISCAVVFAGWLVLPHARPSSAEAAEVKRPGRATVPAA